MASHRAAKFGIKTISVCEEKVKLVSLVVTLLEGLLNIGQVKECKQWVAYLTAVGHPEAAEYKARSVLDSAY